MSGWGHERVGQTDRETKGRREAREEKRQGGKKRQERKEEPRVERGSKSKLCLEGTFEGCACRIADAERHLGPSSPALEADAGRCCSGN